MLHINPHSGVPVYRQIDDQVQLLIRRGSLRAGEQLPSIRELAAQLQINPLTVQRGYDQLAEKGFLVKEPGRGVFVAETAKPQSAAEAEQQIAAELAECIRRGRAAGLSPSRLNRLFADQLDQHS